MRYQNLEINDVDHDFLQFMSDEQEGNILLSATEELIDLANSVRKEAGNTDLVGSEFDDDVYYDFYLMFNTKNQDLSIQVMCNHGEKDDYVYYALPMTAEEKMAVIWQLIQILAKELYNV